jgi:DNA-directed RNA polymerase specialized sigma subunit
MENVLDNGVMDDGIDEPIVPEKIDYKSKDIALYNNWAQTKSKKDMSKLINHLAPILTKEVSSVAGSVPTVALMGEAKIWAIKAVKTFDPNKGFALSTHVTNYIRRTKRVNYKYQNFARLPEHMQLDFHHYNRAVQSLTDEMNEEPTSQHIADRLGWSKSRVDKFKSRIYSDHIESANENPTQVSEFSDNNLLLKSLLSHLNEQETFILNNRGKMSSVQLAEKIGVDTNRLNYLMRKLRDKVAQLKIELGM